MQYICYIRPVPAGSSNLVLDQETMDTLVERVAGELRERLEMMVEELLTPMRDAEPLTVADVAERLGVARSTVYAHWREWGGFKLSEGEKAPIRFAVEQLPASTGDRRRPERYASEALPRPRRRRRRRDLIADAPRLDTSTTAA
jgi:transposase-like protein